MILLWSLYPMENNDFLFDRTELLIGQENCKILADAHVLVLGIGGVGGYALECLARAGIGKLTIIDGDLVDITNCNRCGKKCCAFLCGAFVIQR